MYAVYHLKASDLGSEFLDAVKAMFQDKDVEIVVSAVDETAYLLQSEANRQRLLEAIRHVNRQENLVEVPLGG